MKRQLRLNHTPLYERAQNSDSGQWAGPRTVRHINKRVPVENIYRSATHCVRKYKEHISSR